MRIFYRSKCFYVSAYMLCVCRAVCPVWSGWAWTASVRDLGQTEELRKKKGGGGILWRSNNGWKRRWCKGGVTADGRRKHTVGQTVRESEGGEMNPSPRQEEGEDSVPAYVGAVLGDMKDWWRWKRPAGRLGRTLSDGGMYRLTDIQHAEEGTMKERRMRVGVAFTSCVSDVSCCSGLVPLIPQWSHSTAPVSSGRRIQMF